MASSRTTTIELLRQRCREKPGVTMSHLDDESYKILDVDLSHFACFFVTESPPVIMFRCRDSVRRELQEAASSVTISKRFQWETKGWTWIDVAIDGTVPERTLLELVDESYQMACDRLYDSAKARLSLLAPATKRPDVFSELTSKFGLSRERDQIKKLALPASLLKTSAVSESKLALGQTKIGGHPDLPSGLEWPKFKDGKPLAFLAQINLAELQLATKLADLPKTGLLYFFSVFGWQIETESDPQLPRGEYDFDWTRVLYHPDVRATLKRRRTPTNVNDFKAARVEFVSMNCFPSHTKEPAIARLKWSDLIKDKFDGFVSTYNRACGDQLGYPPRNLMLGYADYEQEFVDEVAKKKLRLLFQLASDENAEMCWGDGGYIYFWIAPKDLAQRNFTNVYTNYQCG